MPLYSHPFTVGLPLAAWPSCDRAAWTQARRNGCPLEGSGLAGQWRHKTVRTAQKAYGAWLRYLQDANRLSQAETVGHRLTECNLRDYIATLRRRVAPQTVVTQLRSLSQAIRAMEPSANRDLLKFAISRLQKSAMASRNKGAQLRSPTDLLVLGQHLMTTWQRRKAHDKRLNAMDYRDGLMIALLALCPVRLENLAQMRIGQHLTFGQGLVRVAFDPHEMKGGKPLEFDFPDVLQERLVTYLQDIYPLLRPGAQLDAPLWPSLRRTQMSAQAIYYRISEVTERHFGYAITPHMFRDAAASFIAEMTPERALMAAAVLQHRTFETTRRHYIHGQQHLAAKRYHAAIANLIVRSQSASEEGFEV